MACPPPLPDGAPGRPKANRYRAQHGVIVVCRDEAHQIEVFERLLQQGFKPRVVVT